jgi:HEAT repeat protein
VQKAVRDDPSPELRLKAVQLLASQPDPITFQKLVRGVSDPDKDVKIASLRALGTSGDPAAAPYITGALKDFDSDVKMEALKALSGLEDKRRAEFNALAAKLRHDYEEAVKRARELQGRQ